MNNTNNTGSDDCPCIDGGSQFDSFIEKCESQDSLGKNYSGVLWYNGYDQRECIPNTYGSNYCDTHDLTIYSSCKETSDTANTPSFCHEKWCYVDFEKCKASTINMVKSHFFSGAELYYSYQTCGETSIIDWEEELTPNALEGKQITATIPYLFRPYHYKYTATGEDADPTGIEYYDDSIPYQGALIDYVNTIVDYSHNIKGVNYTYRTRSSDKLFPSSAYTAAVNDVRLGISDIAIGAFWATSERLQMTSFTTTITFDKISLVTKRLPENKSFAFQVEKLFQPFENNLWWALLGSILAAAIFSVWFSNSTASKKSIAWLSFQKVEWKKESIRRKVYFVSRLLLDSILEKGMFFFGAAVEQDDGDTLPNKLLMFGFSFLILVAISAYVANLAAFLTLSGVSKDFIGSMDDAIAKGIYICANSVLKAELQKKHPSANWVFYNVDDTHGMYNDLYYYDTGRCEALTFSLLDHSADTHYQNELCDRQLVDTGASVLEIPTGFPINNAYDAAFSYWMVNARKRDVFSFLIYSEKYQKPPKCDITLIGQDDDELDALTIENMSFAFMVFTTFLLIATSLHLYVSFQKESHEFHSFIGRKSTLVKSAEITGLEDGKLSDGSLRRLSSTENTSRDSLKLSSFHVNGAEDAVSTAERHHTASSFEMTVGSPKPDENIGGIRIDGDGHNRDHVENKNTNKPNYDSLVAEEREKLTEKFVSKVRGENEKLLENMLMKVEGKLDALFKSQKEHEE